MLELDIATPAKRKYESSNLSLDFMLSRNLTEGVLLNNQEWLEQKKQERQSQLTMEENQRQNRYYETIKKLLPDNILHHGVYLGSENGCYWHLAVPNHKHIDVTLCNGPGDGYHLKYSVGSKMYANFYDALIAAEKKPKKSLLERIKDRFREGPLGLY